jgi:hypothetical protein
MKLANNLQIFLLRRYMTLLQSVTGEVVNVARKGSYSKRHRLQQGGCSTQSLRLRFDLCVHFFEAFYDQEFSVANGSAISADMSRPQCPRVHGQYRSTAASWSIRHALSSLREPAAVQKHKLTQKLLKDSSEWVFRPYLAGANKTDMAEQLSQPRQ